MDLHLYTFAVYVYALRALKEAITLDLGNKKTKYIENRYLVNSLYSVCMNINCSPLPPFLLPFTQNYLEAPIPENS